ncbi:hypothetical protein BH10PSE6_BH10PSE6_42430 [soil metagenome]
MSDYIPKDPLTPNPNDPRGYDRYGNAKFEPVMEDSAGKGPYILLGLLVAIGLIGGLLYFNGSPTTSTDVAQARNPAPIERTAPPIERTSPPVAAPGAPSLTPANPAPATPVVPADRPAAPPATQRQ